MQSYFSNSLHGLEHGYQENYGLKSYINKNKPCCFFGVYREEDLRAILNHQSKAWVIFTGMDALTIPKDWISQIHHPIIAISDAIHKQLPNSLLIGLWSADIDYFSHPTEVNSKMPYFWYGGDGSESSLKYYGVEHLPTDPIIRANFGQYNKRELREIYNKCCVNLRLSEFDGCANTVMEMGLMGRISYFNHDSQPYTRKWQVKNDINKCDLPSPHLVSQCYKNLYESNRSYFLQTLSI